jgi:opine dehydrogenase
MSIYAVLGAGNGGQLLAAMLKNMGHEVRLWSRNTEIVEILRHRKNIEVNGVRSFSASPDLISDNISEVISNSKIIFVVTPATAHKNLARLIVSSVQPSQIVVLNPGRTAGALEFRQTLLTNGCKSPPLIVETQSLLYTCRLESPGCVNVLAIKKKNLLACLPQGREPEIEKELSAIYKGLTFAPNTLVTGLENIGAMLHPAPVLLNTGWIESHDGFFSHYYFGISETLAMFIETIDKERMSVAKAFGVHPRSVAQWHEEVYGHRGKNLLETLRLNESYASTAAPQSLDHRYVFEDIPTGLVPISELGRVAGVATPRIDIIIELAKMLTGIDFREEGRNLKGLGFQGMSVEQIIKMV